MKNFFCYLLSVVCCIATELNSPYAYIEEFEFHDVVRVFAEEVSFFSLGNSEKMQDAIQEAVNLLKINRYVENLRIPSAFHKDYNVRLRLGIDKFGRLDVSGYAKVFDAGAAQRAMMRFNRVRLDRLFNLEHDQEIEEILKGKNVEDFFTEQSKTADDTPETVEHLVTGQDSIEPQSLESKSLCVEVLALLMGRGDLLGNGIRLSINIVSFSIAVPFFFRFMRDSWISPFRTDLLSRSYNLIKNFRTTCL